MQSGIPRCIRRFRVRDLPRAKLHSEIKYRYRYPVYELFCILTHAFTLHAACQKLRGCELNVKGQITGTVSIIGTRSGGIRGLRRLGKGKEAPGASLFRHPVETSELVCCSRGAARLGSAVIPYGDVVAIDARQLECLLCVDVFPPTHRDVSLV